MFKAPFWGAENLRGTFHQTGADGNVGPGDNLHNHRRYLPEDMRLTAGDVESL
jgi:hypothetical protein